MGFSIFRLVGIAALGSWMDTTNWDDKLLSVSSVDSNTSICRMCLKERKLIKAHIIPQSLYPHNFGPADQTKIYWTDPDRFPKRSSIGVYDTSIVCLECERLFQDCDQYGQEVLLNKPFDTAAVHFDLGNFDYALLKRFFICVLWRASVSSHVMFSRVSVGEKHELRLRELILQNQTPDRSRRSRR